MPLASPHDHLKAVPEERSLRIDSAGPSPFGAEEAQLQPAEHADSSAPKDGHPASPGYTRSSSLARTLSRTASSIATARSMVRTLSQPLQPESLPPPTILDLWKVRWRMITAMFLVYVVTLCIFPGFLAEDVKARGGGREGRPGARMKGGDWVR